MENKPKNSDVTLKTEPEKGIPFLLKATALLLVVYGIIGLGYYLITAVYSISNSQFLDHLEFSSFSGNGLFIPIFIEIIIHIAVILAGFFIIYKKKQGSYYFYFAFLFSMIFSFFIMGEFNTIELGFGSIILVIILFYRKILV